MEAAAWGFVGTLVGALASIGTSWLASRSAATAQREKVQLEWRQQHREFQIKAATELQEILVEFARATGQIRHIDEMREAQGQTGKSQIDSILSDLYSQHIRRINVLLGRIDSQAVQCAFTDVKRVSIEITIGVRVNTQTMLGFSDVIERAGIALSEYLKSIYETELSV